MRVHEMHLSPLGSGTDVALLPSRQDMQTSQQIRATIDMSKK